MWLRSLYGLIRVVHGAAPGADTLADEEAKALDIPRTPYPAAWRRYGHSAGLRRNTEMLHVERPLIVVAFHDHLAFSKGTKHMCVIAVQTNTPVYLYTHEQGHPPRSIPREKILAT